MTDTATILNTPWSLVIDQDGTENVAIIQDAAGDTLVTSRPFWVPEDGEPVPPTLAAMRAMAAAPKLLEALYELTAAALDTTRPFYPQPHHKSLGIAVEQARAAIAEAEGRAA